MGNHPLVAAGLGRLATRDIDPRTMEQKSASSGCTESTDTAWTGSATMRSRIDAFYSDRVTCLARVFDDVLAEDAAVRTNLILTDAEQDAPAGSDLCPSAKNLGSVQANLNKWVRRGHSVGVIAFTLRSQTWRSDLEPRQYCACDRRNLYLYLLTPSAQETEQIYLHVASRWKGPQDAIAFLPFAPHPASQFDVTMRVSKAGGGRPEAVIPSRATADLTNPKHGQLPVFWIRLDGAHADVSFNVKAVAFEDAKTMSAPGYVMPNWKAATYEWQPPRRLEAAASKPVQADESKSKEAGSAPAATARAKSPAPYDETASLEFLELPAPVASAAAPTAAADMGIVREGHYIRGQRIADQARMITNLSEARYRLRRIAGKSGRCELFLIDLHAVSSDYMKQVLDTQPVVKQSNSACLHLDHIRDQMLFVHKPSSVIRFLLHVDY
jgi:hypothetical protein